MFGRIAAFEFRYQVRQPVFWVAAAFFFLIVFGSMTVDNIQIGGGGGGVHKNAPTAIALTHLVMSIFFIFVTAAMVANVIVRDDETGFGPLIRSTRITRLDYLLGRFTGAFGAAALVFLAVPLGLFAGSLAPWVDPETLGPNRLGAYAYAYGALALPSIFLTSALFFALATTTRSMMATYIGATALLILWVIMGTLATRNEMRELAAWLDPFGAIAVGEATRYYTTFESNSRLPPAGRGASRQPAAVDRPGAGRPGWRLPGIPLRDPAKWPGKGPAECRRGALVCTPPHPPGDRDAGRDAAAGAAGPGGSGPSPGPL